MERQEQIGFKLPTAYIDELTKRGESLGLSRHQYARMLVVEALSDTNAVRVLDKLKQLDEKYTDRWEELVTAVANLFIHSGKLSVEEATGWVEENMPS